MQTLTVTAKDEMIVKIQSLLEDFAQENSTLDDFVTIEVKPAKQNISVLNIAGSLQHKTTVTATVEEMNESVADMFTNWKG